MPPERIFISSVMRGFGAEREAVRAAVASLRLQPVMAEDFGAQPHSPQAGCLEGVRSSDVHVGVFGARYGSPTASGKSATEEEFDEALARGLPILCFIQAGDKEAEQEAFLQRVKLYETGFLVARFATPTELSLQVVQALNDLLGRPGVAAIDAAAASALFDGYRWALLPDPRSAPRHHPWLGAVVVPERQGEPYLSFVEFGQQRFREQLLQPALFGATAIFRRNRGMDEREEADALVVEQTDPERNDVLASLEVHTDGALVYGLALGQDRPAGDSMIRMFVVDEDEVERVLGAFVAFANDFYGRIEQSPLIANVFLGTSLSGIEGKAFGRYPSVDPSQMTLPDHRLEDPLRVPRPPLRVARAALADPSGLARRVTDHITREFRLAGAYYTPPRP
jgi:Domain of unknown function (DUF4062)